MVKRTQQPPDIGRLQIDPPPFYLHAEVRRGRSLWRLPALATGFALPAAYAVLIGASRPIPSLALLMAVSLVSASFYLGVRFFAYWAAWLRAMTAYQAVGGIHPAARGELPRNYYVFVLLAPVGAFAAAALVPALWGTGFGAEITLAAAVVVGISIRDAQSALSLLAYDSKCWIKETDSGFDVLKPIERAREDEP